ncbi:MAG: TlyA family RNA methyltransferase [Actinomycetota bacterium]|nr:TlyA family RNA methyltransferase [Actinomycetota bacterium]
MATRRRLDTELVRRGLVSSRAEAQDAIVRGQVLVKGVPATRAATMVDAEESIKLDGPARRFVSRGGEKLDGALDRLGLEVADRAWLDAGASTGGFTDCLLQRGARSVVAVDVGYGQLDLRLRNDPRVTVLERTNVRNLVPSSLPALADGVVADLSFISLRVVIGALVACATPDADHVLLVKPQFEAGPDRVGRGGVVRDAGVWLATMTHVVEAGREHGLGLVGATYSDPPGPAGNREFFLHLRRDGASDAAVLTTAIKQVAL